MSAPNTETLIDARFRVLDEVGRGGMAAVYRAVDTRTEQVVAIKVLDVDHDRERFAREANVLAELVHPRIVRYLAHGDAGGDGATGKSRAYLAMEWLEGETLSQRLTRAPLTLRESIAIVRDIADGLTMAHVRGVVHRDLKPSNIVLRDKRADAAVLLDFGVARRLFDARGPATKTGMVVGTPQYMAPEQAAGERAIGPAADVFALGAILYECLTGRSPFAADHLVGILAKILFAEVEPLEEVRPELPGNVVAAVKAMLAKEQAQRPADAGAVVELLDELGELPDLGPAGTSRTPTGSMGRLSAPRISSSEQQLVCVIVASVDEALSSTLCSRLGIEVLSDGSCVAAFTPDAGRVATDAAMHAARVAIEIREHAPTARISMTTGRGVVQERLPVGDAIDRAVLRVPATPGIVVDELSAALLDRRFEITGGSRLVAEQTDPDAHRVLLGKPTPCVGREQELSTLEGALSNAIDEAMPSAVVVTAPAGLGKTRLRHELIRRAQTRYPELHVIAGVADVSQAGATYGVLANAIGELRTHHDLLANVAPADRKRIGDLLAELCGTPVADPTAELVRVRSEPRRLGEEIASAFLALLRAEAGAHPVMLVLEDIHWADRASLELIERALRELRDVALFVVALQRPHHKDSLWAGYALHLPLRPLGKKACERLAREVLGPQVTADVVARVVDQAAGNALFLEELIRAVADGRRELPDSVIAILQSRISGLPPELRRVLRTASVFGEKFPRDGLAALLAEPTSAIDRWLEELVRREIVEPRRDQFAFRHALLGEAAYAMLTDGDKVEAHRAVAEYLDGLGGQEPVELADHYQKGGAHEQAVSWYMRAGAESNAVGDLVSARIHFAAASDALRQLPDGPAQIRQRVDILLQQIQMGMMAELSDLQLARAELARDLLASVEPEPADQRRALMTEFITARVLLYMGRYREARELCERVGAIGKELGDVRISGIAAQAIGNTWLMQGHITRAQPLLEEGADIVDRIPGDYDRLRFMGNLGMCLTLGGRCAEANQWHDRAVEAANVARHSSIMAVALTMQASSYRTMGDPREHATVTHALEHTSRAQEILLHYLMIALQAWAAGLAGDRERWRVSKAEAISLADTLGSERCYDDLLIAADAEVAVALGELDEAIHIASTHVPRFAAAELAQGHGLCEQAWALALVARGQHDEADLHFERGRSVFAASGQAIPRARLELAWAKALAKRGDGRADALVAAARDTYVTGGALGVFEHLLKR